MPDPRARALNATLARIGRSDAPAWDIAQAALLIAAHDHPRDPIAPLEAHLQEIAASARRAVPADATPEAAAKALRDVLVARFGYRGDDETYDDPRNADLIEVIRRRRGLPVALGVLWIHAARAAGQVAAGINFPSHFLVTIGPAEAAVIVDAFAGGELLTSRALGELATRATGEPLAGHHLARADDRSVLLRLQNNLLTRALQAKDGARALAIAERMALIAPEDAALHAELGRIAAAEGHMLRAADAYSHAVSCSRSAAIAGQASEALKLLRRRLN